MLRAIRYPGLGLGFSGVQSCYRRLLHTLRPENLTPADLVDFSDKAQPVVVCGNEKFLTRYENRVGSEGRDRDNFPADSRGFLYYHPTHPVLGGVRLRLAESPASFEAGTDLLLANGTPWSIPLMNIIQTPKYEPLCAQLQADGLVSAVHIHELRELARAAGLRRWKRGNKVISTLEDSFELDLASRRETIWILRPPKHIGRVHFTQLFEENRISNTWTYPYSGSILCSFECAECTSGKPSLVIRVLKITRTIRAQPGYDGWVPVPVEGELLQVQSAHTRDRKRVHTVWTCDAERASRAEQFSALKLLLEDM